MYGIKWSFLLMYESHNMIHTDFLWIDGLSMDPRDLGRHIIYYYFAFKMYKNN